MTGSRKAVRISVLADLRLMTGKIRVIADWQVSGFRPLTGAFVFERRPTERCELADRRARRLIPSCLGC